MNEKKIKILSLIGKIAGVATTAASKLELLPPKYAWLGVIVLMIATTSKDLLMYLGDLWDDGVLNKSYKPEAKP